MNNDILQKTSRLKAVGYMGYIAICNDETIVCVEHERALIEILK